MPSLIALLRRRPRHPVLPFDGFTPSITPIPRLDGLTDADLRELNAIVQWNCFTVDSRGRRFGDCGRAGKRDEPQVIPDRRIALFDQRFGLRGRHVLEVGCFEAVHTIGLSRAGARVTAIDARMENVVKAILRCNYYDAAVDIRRCNVEIEEELQALPNVELLHHVGVLYHLADPVRHLQLLASKVGLGMMLDTHVASPERASDSFSSGGRNYRYQRVVEAGLADVFAGMYDHARWLRTDDLMELLRELGFKHTVLHEERAERNGPRVLIFAQR